MDREKWFFFDSGGNHPAYNMALDEILLKGWSGLPVVLRLYGWTPPGLSLGYFQKYEEMESLSTVKDCGAVITRRITGGDAILHINELTFSITGIDGAYPFNGSVEASYDRIHLAIAAGFKRLGVDSEQRESKPVDNSQTSSAAGRCFYRVTRYDLVSGGVKLVGSAQRRTKGRVLHHGSIPLDKNPLTPGSADLSSLSGRTISYEDAKEAVCAGIEESLSVKLVESLPDQSFFDEAKHLAESKYDSAEWIKRR